jgi:hypothetical protein
MTADDEGQSLGEEIIGWLEAILPRFPVSRSSWSPQVMRLLDRLGL